MNKEYIFDAAVSLFGHQGIRATRMDDVAEFLHMSKRTLYEQFPSKEEFIVACIEYEMKKELETVDRLEYKTSSPLKFMSKLYLHSIRYLSSFHPSFFKDLKRFPSCNKKLDQYISILRIKFNEILLECIHLGLCVKDCDTFLFSAFLSIRLENIKNGVIYPQKEKTPGLSKFVIKSMLMGYMTDKGKEHIISI